MEQSGQQSEGDATQEDDGWGNFGGEESENEAKGNDSINMGSLETFPALPIPRLEFKPGERHNVFGVERELRQRITQNRWRPSGPQTL